MKTIIITGIISIALLEGFALYLGFNGYVLTAVVAAIAGLAGWVAPQLKVK